MQIKLTLETLSGTTLKHKLIEARHLWGTTPLIIAAIMWGIVWMATSGSINSLVNILLMGVVVLSGIFLCANLCLLKVMPKDHALIDDQGNILLDFKRAAIVSWRWEYWELLKKGSLVAYEYKVHDIEIRAEMRKYRILFLTGYDLAESRALEKTIKELTVMRLTSPEDIVKVNFYDVLRDYPAVVADLKNPLRTEEQEVFYKLLKEHLMTRLSGMGIRIVPLSTRFDWA
jgi:hypothetical protein